MPDIFYTLTKRGSGKNIKFDVDGESRESKFGGAKIKDKHGANKVTFPDDLDQLTNEQQEELARLFAQLILGD